MEWRKRRRLEEGCMKGSESGLREGASLLCCAGGGKLEGEDDVLHGVYNTMSASPGAGGSIHTERVRSRRMQ
jgi:hypothetical protein